MGVTPDDLSVEQKVALLAGADTWHTASFDDPPVAAIRMSDGPAGVRGTSWEGLESASFPCGAALGATFDPELVEDVGRALGREARRKSAHVVLAPTVNLHRTPIGGRNFECMSEDPVLTAAIAVAYVRGLQGEGVAACVKHLVGNDTEHERMTISSDVDERTLRELYLVPFERVVHDADVRVVMSAYNRLDGTFCGEHPWLLTTLLRDEWGFDGVVVSDWFGCHSAGESLRAGLDLEMPGPALQRGSALHAELDAGEVTVADVDRSVSRLLALGDWVGASTTGTDEAATDDDRTRALIRLAATRAAVLLQNGRQVLPLGPEVRSVALIGPYADRGRPQGGGSARVQPAHGAGPLAALEQRGLDVRFEAGTDIAKYLRPMRGEFVLTSTFGSDELVEETMTRLARYFDHGRGIHLVGEFIPDVSGAWELGARAVGPFSVRVDDREVFAVPKALRGGAYFGIGSPELRTTIELEAGRGCSIELDAQAADELVAGFALGARPPSAGDELERAVAAAADADVAIVIVGTDDDWETEGEDRTTLTLPGTQDELVAAVAAANPNTVVVLNAGSPVTMPWLADVPAVVQLWFPGQEVGDALVDVLVGDAEPGGRLPITFPARLEDTPAFDHHPGRDGHAVYAERLHIGHRWYDRHDIEPLFPFGHGLGYTTFDIEPVGVTGSVDGATVTVDVANTGDRPGGAVVQVYVEPPPGDPDRPLRHLAGFARADLAAGEQRTVTVEVGGRAFASWLDGAWTVQPGDYAILVGRSSRDLTPAGTVTA